MPRPRQQPKRRFGAFSSLSIHGDRIGVFEGEVCLDALLLLPKADGVALHSYNRAPELIHIRKSGTLRRYVLPNNRWSVWQRTWIRRNADYKLLEINPP